MNDIEIKAMAREHARKVMDMPEERFTPTIPVLDPIEHNEGRTFCSDPACPCREDRDNINTLNELIECGLLTKDEAELIKRGATI